MLTIRASDYYSIGYDAAAQNRIDQLEGNTYERILEQQTVTQIVTELTTVRTKASFTPGTWDISFLQNNYDYRLGVSGSWQILTSITAANTYQYTVLGDYEVTFSDLNLPEEATIAATVTPTITSKQTNWHPGYQTEESTDDAAMLGYLDTDGYSPINGFYNCNSNEEFCLTACTKWDAEPKMDCNLAEAESRTIDRVANGVPPLLNADPKGSASYFGIEASEMEVVWAAPSFQPKIQYARAIRNLYTQTITKESRDVVKVSGRMPVATMHNSRTSGSRLIYMGVLEQLQVSLTYGYAAWNASPFKYTHEGSKGEYPYKFDGESLANSGDNVAGTPWSSYYPNQIFDRYAKGKYYIQLRVRAKFMLLNDARIDTEVQIYDLRGRLISRGGTPCTFKIKRIIKTFDHGEFTYTINCLEE